MSPRANPGAVSGPADAREEPRLVEVFEAFAAEQPDAAAVVTEGGALTFGALNRDANRVAHLILARGGIRGDRIAILNSPGPNIFALMLGVLKAGRICVILDPHEPAERLKQIVSDAEPLLVLADAGSFAAAVSVADSPTVVSVDEAASCPATNPGGLIDPEEIAALVYTSGSTGRPKAVMKSHGHLLLQPRTAGREMEIGPGDRVLMLAALSGGQGMNTAWVALANGATLITFPAGERGVTGLAECIADNRVTVFVSSAALFRAFGRTIDRSLAFPSVRVGTLAGDAATWDDYRAFRRHFPNGRMVTAYAASEAGYITLLSLSGDDASAEGPLPVGRPSPQRGVRIVGENGEQLPPGAVGRVEVTGPHLASGYWRDPELSARTFPRDASGERFFRSSDLGVLTPDGAVLLRGRDDDAIKLRGHRVDLAEVDAALASLPGVTQAAAAVSAAPGGEPRLVGYVVLDATAPSERHLRIAARATVPRHLIPVAFVAVEAIPTTANGKPDRARLRMLPLPAIPGSHEPPETPTEESLAAIWGEALGLETIGPTSDFFALGGDSLVAAEVAARVFTERGVQLSLGAFFDAPTLRELARFIDVAATGNGEPDDIPVVRIPRDQPAPLSLNQHYLWRVSRTPRQASRFNVGNLIEMDGALDRDAFRRALDLVVARHEPLRTRFMTIDGEPRQRVEPAGQVALPFTDLSAETSPQASAQRMLRDEIWSAFDLDGGPLVRFKLLALGPNRHALLRASHHSISDAPSWNTFVSDLAEAYAALISGRQPDLPEIPFQYVDFSVWQRRIWARGSRSFEDAIAWWRARAGEIADASFETRRLWFMLPSPAPEASHPPSITWGLDAPTATRLERLSQAESATFYTTRVAALVPVLAATLTSRSVLLRTYFTRRNRAEFEHTFGMFVDTAPLIVPVDPAMSFRDHLRRVRAVAAETARYADAPFELIEEALRSDSIRLPNSPFQVHMPTQSPAIFAAGIRFEADAGLRRSVPGVQFWFDQVREREGGATLQYDERIYDPEALRALIAQFQRFASAAAAAPERPLAELLAAAGVPEGGRPRG